MLFTFVLLYGFTIVVNLGFSLVTLYLFTAIVCVCVCNCNFTISVILTNIHTVFVDDIITLPTIIGYSNIVPTFDTLL